MSLRIFNVGYYIPNTFFEMMLLSAKNLENLGCLYSVERLS